MQKLLIILLAGCCFFSCDSNQPTPAFIHIEEFDFAALPGEGTSSENITELWVYQDGVTMLGAYDLPADIPVLSEGNTGLRIYPGIKNNGISTTRIIYPFYTYYETNLNLESGAEYQVTPSFKYREDLAISEYDFESGIPMEPYGTNSGQFELVSDDRVFEGDKSGFATLEPDQAQLLYRTENSFEWTAGETVFLEMNYSCNNTFAVGLYAINSANETRNFALILNPTREGTGDPVWKKVYVDLGFVIKENSNADHFELYIESVHDVSGNTVELYFDNLKLVQYD
ncbi:MAG: hypothetical protein JNM00_14020 [Flavobacteriales bacterium]|nr:hypothetical protein [Flavobacteriales bacterium]